MKRKRGLPLLVCGVALHGGADEFGVLDHELELVHGHVAGLQLADVGRVAQVGQVDLQELLLAHVEEREHVVALERRLGRGADELRMELAHRQPDVLVQQARERHRRGKRPACTYMGGSGDVCGSFKSERARKEVFF